MYKIRSSRQCVSQLLVLIFVSCCSNCIHNKSFLFTSRATALNRSKSFNYSQLERYITIYMNILQLLLLLLRVSVNYFILQCVCEFWVHSLITESTDSRTIFKKLVKNVVFVCLFLQNFDEFRHHLFTDCPYLVLFTFNIKPKIW